MELADLRRRVEKQGTYPGSSTVTYEPVSVVDLQQVLEALGYQIQAPDFTRVGPRGSTYVHADPGFWTPTEEE